MVQGVRVLSIQVGPVYDPDLSDRCGCQTALEFSLGCKYSLG
jgi:hypothetical protein